MSSLIHILNDGTKIPRIAFGCGSVLSGQDVSTSVLNALESGITHIDGAQYYKNEESLGAGISSFLSTKSHRREDIFITTKLFPTTPPEGVKPGLQESLKTLGLDYVDLFLIHSPNPANQEKGRLEKLWKAMEEVKKDGLARSIGVSNFRVVDFEEILPSATIIPVVNQLELHPYVWKATEPIAKLCKELGITLASYGGLTPIVRAAGGPLDPILEAARQRIQTLAGEDISASQILTKWILQKGALVVTTSSKSDRIKATLKVVDLPDLTDEEMKAIDEAGSKLHRRVYMQFVFGEE